MKTRLTEEQVRRWRERDRLENIGAAMDESRQLRDLARDWLDMHARIAECREALEACANLPEGCALCGARGDCAAGCDVGDLLIDLGGDDE